MYPMTEVLENLGLLDFSSLNTVLVRTIFYFFNTKYHITLICNHNFNLLYHILNISCVNIWYIK